jgi:hypothetical protein
MNRWLTTHHGSSGATHSAITTVALVVSTLTVAISLSGCAADPTDNPGAQEPRAPSAAPEPTVEPVTRPLTPFSRPLSCETLVPQVRRDAFRAEGLILLGGPGGKYGTTYLAERTPEEEFGGITCIWGTDSDDVSVYTVSAALVSSATLPSIVADLEQQGLNTDPLDAGSSGSAGSAGSSGSSGSSDTSDHGDAAYFWLLGDDAGAPAILNVVRDDSWISVIVTEGGETSFDTAIVIASEVADQGYES